MNGHLFLHIGPAKTATTSLQYALQDYKTDGFEYLGTRQPRPVADKSIAALFHAHSSGLIDYENHELRAAVNQVADFVQNGNITVLSEEMFLVWTESVSFWRKLERLERLVANIPHTYLITLRAPCDVLPSYYQEMYRGIPTIEKLFPQRFFMHERCDCYNYIKLIRWFHEHGASVNTIDFRDFSKRAISMFTIFGNKYCNHDILSIRNENAGRKIANTDQREFPPLTLAQAIAVGPLRSTGKLLRQHAPQTAERVQSILSKVLVKKVAVRAVSVPVQRLSLLTNAYEEALRQSSYPPSDEIR